jgi:sugar phosphate isomerase/epimerase
MKIAYGTYATPTLPLEESLIMMANMGYEGVELAIGPKHAMPENLSSSQRQQLKKVLAELKLDVPGFLMLGSALSGDKDAHNKRLDLTQQVIQLAKDLGIKRTPVISTGSGGGSASWESQRDNLVNALDDYAKIASDEGAIIAVEAHVNAMLDRTERAIWLMKTIDNPVIRLHFDIVHFFLMKEPIRETVFALVPYTAHTHVTDARILEKGFELVLLGQGELDCVQYIKAMQDAGWTDFITIEVSAMVWSKEGYDPLKAASISYDALNSAIKSAIEIKRS